MKNLFTFLPLYLFTSEPNNPFGTHDTSDTFGTSQTGASHLVLVLVAATIMTLLAFSIQIITFLQTRQAAGSQQTKAAYFAAEGAIFETIQHLRDDSLWPPSFPYSDIYQIEDSDITRELTLEDGLITIEVNASAKGSKRKLVSTYQRQSQDSPPLDVMLVIDRSGSMKFLNDPTKPRGIDAAKDAAHTFVDILEDSDVVSQIGLVTYNHQGRLDQSLTTLFDEMRDQIDNINAGGATNIGDAVNIAYQELDLNSRNDSVKVMVVLSDGVAQRSTLINGTEFCRNQNQSCHYDACLIDNSGFSPNNQGNCCSQNAIDEAAIAKNLPRDYLTFSVSLGSNYSNSHPSCQTLYGNDQTALEKTIDLGRLTMLGISSERPGQQLPQDGEQLTYYKETDDTQELESLFAQIASSISSPEFFSYIETDPDPD